MQKILLIFSLSLIALTSHGQSPTDSTATDSSIVSPTFSLASFYAEDSLLDQQVDTLYARLSSRQRISQMIINAAGRLGWPDGVIEQMLEEELLGGILMLNGSKTGFQLMKAQFDSVAALGSNLPILYSADAELSLINRKIKGVAKVKQAFHIDSIEECIAQTQIINQELKEIGILQNFAPVCDLSPDNEAIGFRTFGNEPGRVIQLSQAFIETSQNEGIVATAKHFPGHGLVKGDSHDKLVYIDSLMQEVPYYQPLIDSGVISVMVGHIAVRNHPEYGTEGLPASCSLVIVSDLLKDSLNFQGIVVTDAMNMGALRTIPNANLKAVEAGCDMILMPGNVSALRKLISDVEAKMQSDPTFAAQIETSVKKVIRLKLCLGLR